MKPVYTSSFDLPAEGQCIFQCSEITFIDNSEKGLSAKVKSEITDSEHPENIGMNVSDNFPLAKEFGASRFLGFLVKSIGLPEKEYPETYFEDKKIQAKIESKVPGATFGGVIKHTKKDDQTYPNIKEYYTKDEMKKLLSEKDKKAPSKVKTTSEAPAKEEAPAGDGW